MVTGGCGFIGSHCVYKLASEGYKVVCFDLTIRENEYLNQMKDKIVFAAGDIRNLDKLLKLVDDEKIDAIVHTAALPVEPKCREDPVTAFNVNLVGTFNVAEIARRKSIKLINTSSQALYGNLHEQDLTPIREDVALPPPKGVYPAQKLMGETLVTSYRNAFGVNAFSLRPNWAYGPLQASIENPVSMILKKAIKGESFILDKGGDHPLGYTYGKDFANAVFLGYKKDKVESSAFNIDSGEFVTVRKVAEIIGELYPQVEIKVGSGLWPELMKQAPLRGPGDLSRAKKELGYEPKYTIDVGIKEYAEWLEKNIE